MNDRSTTLGIKGGGTLQNFFEEYKTYLIFESFCSRMLSFSRTCISNFGFRSSTEQVRKKDSLLHALRNSCRNPVKVSN